MSKKQEKVKCGVIKVEYNVRGDMPIIHLFVRDEYNERHHILVYGFEPYFYIREFDSVKRDKRIKRIESVDYCDLKGIPVKKIVCNIPSDVGGRWKNGKKVDNGLRAKYKNSYEDDIRFVLRFLIDTLVSKGMYLPSNNNINYNQLEKTDFEYKPNLRVSGLDIEVSRPDLTYSPDWRRASDPILSLQAYDSYIDRYIVFAFHGGLKEKEKKIIEKFKTKKSEKREFSLWLFKNEKDMIETYIDFIEDTNPDVLTAWNGRYFDYPYLVNRCKKLNISYKRLSPMRKVYTNKKGKTVIGGRVLLDSMKGYQKLTLSEEESYGLDYISFKLLKFRKIKYKGTINDLRKKSFREFIEYGVRDVYLEQEIIKKRDIVNFYYRVKNIANCQMNDIDFNSRIVDCYCLTKAKYKNMVLPSRPNYSKEEEKRVKSLMEEIKGAVVFQPLDFKLFEDVIGLDLKSSYPSTAASFNIGEDTVVYEKDVKNYDKSNLIKTPIKGLYFRKDKNSFLKEIFIELLDRRDGMKRKLKKISEKCRILEEKFKENENSKFKKLLEKFKVDEEVLDIQQTVIKFITNSFYGVLLNIYFRLFNIKFAKCILEGSRESITFASDVSENEMDGMYKRLYGDTDSIYMLSSYNGFENIKKKSKELQEYVNKRYDDLASKYNIDDHYFLLDFEKYYETLMFFRKKGSEEAAKKNYAGLMKYYKGVDYPDGKLDIKGLDRSDLSRVCRKLREKVLEMQCRKEDRRKIINTIRYVIQKIFKLDFKLEEIAFPKGIRQPLEEYDNQDWIRGARWTNDWAHTWGGKAGYGAGSKPKFIYLRKGRIPSEYSRTDICALDQNNYLPEDVVKAIDFEKLIEKTIEEKLVNIIEVYDISWINVIKNAKTRSVMSGN